MAVAANLTAVLGLDSARFRTGLDRARRSSNTFQARLSRNLRGLERGFLNLRTAIVGAFAVLGTRALLNQADELERNARAAGISFDAYQQLASGFEQSGISAERFTRASARLSTVIVDAGRGLSTAVDALNLIGLSFEDLENLSPEDRFIAVTRALDMVEDATVRQAAATRLLGRTFANFRVNINDVIRDGSRIVTISDMSAAAAQAFNDSITRLTTSLRNSITNAIAPFLSTLTQFADRFNLLLQDEERLQNFVTALSNAFTRLGVVLRVALTAWLAVRTALFAQAAISAIATTVTAIVRVTRAIVALTRSFQILISTTGVGILVTIFGTAAGVGAAVAGARAVENAINDINAELDVALGQIPDFNDEVNNITNATNGAAASISDLGDNLSDVTNTQLPAFQRTLENAVDTASRISEVGSRAFDGLADSLTDFVTTGMANFADLARSIIRDLIRIQIRAQLANVFGLATGGAGGGFLSAIFGGFRQFGGPVQAGRAFVVGEAGPELFIPRSAGNIVPNDAAGGGSNVTLNITTLDSQSFDDYITSPRARESIAAAVDINNRDRGF